MATISEDVFEAIKAGDDDGGTSTRLVVAKACGAVADSIDDALDDEYLDTRRALKHVADELRIVASTYN